MGLGLGLAHQSLPCGQGGARSVVYPNPNPNPDPNRAWSTQALTLALTGRRAHRGLPSSALRRDGRGAHIGLGLQGGSNRVAGWIKWGCRVDHIGLQGGSIGLQGGSHRIAGRGALRRDGRGARHRPRALALALALARTLTLALALALALTLALSPSPSPSTSPKP